MKKVIISALAILVMAGTAYAQVPSYCPAGTNAWAGPRTDATAELPRTCIPDSFAVSPGLVVPVPAGANLQAAYNSMSCGQTLALAHGASWPSTGLAFTPKNCPDTQWLTIMSDGTLPPAGSRISPNSLAQMASIVFPTLAPATILINGDHINFVGIAFQKTIGGAPIVAMLTLAGANKIVFDRDYFHGNPSEETRRALDLSGASNVAVIGSMADEIHCIAVTGTCGDSQAILGGLNTSATQDGTYRIFNNDLSAAGEIIFFGGGAATTTPTDIEIRENYLHKPLSWNPNDPTFMGTSYVVKNFVEIKNGQRVLIEGNAMSYNWGGFSQNGFAVLFTPVNQSSQCPICQTTDVTLRYNAISHVGSGLQMANALAGGGPQKDGQRYSVHDITIDDIDPVHYNGSGYFLQISVTDNAPPLPPLQNIAINHVTAFPPHSLMIVGNNNATNGPIKNFIFTNNMISAGQYPVWSSTGLPSDCSTLDQPVSTFASCFIPNTYGGDAIIGNDPHYVWPVGTLFPATPAAVGFTSYNNGIGGNYQLLSTSPYHNAGLDGLDIGVSNWPLFNALINFATGTGPTPPIPPTPTNVCPMGTALQGTIVIAPLGAVTISNPVCK